MSQMGAGAQTWIQNQGEGSRGTQVVWRGDSSTTSQVGHEEHGKAQHPSFRSASIGEPCVDKVRER